jgi:serine/threonine protein kinase
MLAALRRDLASGQAIGPYRILEPSSEDALGRGYVAEHPRLGARVAVKVIAREPARPPEAIERFFREARAVNALRHERIVEILDLGTLADGSAFVVTEHLEGAPLSRLFEERGPLPLGGLARLAGEVLDAVAAAHDHGLVHGELLPERVFVTAAGHAKVLDFGVGGLRPRADERARRPRPGSEPGASRYRAPEQARGEVSARSDVYAIGAILAEGVATAPPGGVPAALEAVLRRATAEDPAARFAGAREMASALAAAARELPPGALLVQPLPPAVLHRRRGAGGSWLALVVGAAVAVAGVLASLAAALD